MQAVTGVVQHYAWGAHDWLPRFLGLEPDGRPWAEWWLGTHPRGPARLADGTALADVTGPLPYLLKVLAVDAPLSMQAHPDVARARDGFDRGVYPDDRAKPELLVALTEFEALCGIRPAAASVSLLTEIGLDELAAGVATDGAGAVVRRFLAGDGTPPPDVVVDACRRSPVPEARLVADLDARYPGEPSVVVALLLNRVVLEPGEGLRLDPGHLHAYVRGAAVELMGPSDNVVRAGLTPKAVDVGELLNILDPTPIDDPVLPASGRYELPLAGVDLLRIDVGRTHASTGHELAVGLDGTAWYAAPGDRIGPGFDGYVVVGRPD